MSYSATVFKVMIASPSDVESERVLVRNAIYEWNNINSESRQTVLMPVGWDTHSAPSMEARAQSVINTQVLADCDLLVAIFWTRLGTPTGEAPSGTVEEIQKHVAAGKPTMIYFSSAPVRPDSVDGEQYTALREFRSQCEKKGLVEVYEDLGEFREKFFRQLSIRVNEDLSPIPIDPSMKELYPEDRSSVASSIPRLTEEAKNLLVEAARAKDGLILKVRSLSGLAVQAGGTNFVDQGNPRSEALWQNAVELLADEGLIVDRGSKGEVFGLTADGYEVADTLAAGI